MSQGSLVKDEKCSYIHKHGKCPYLEKDGHRYYCPVRENTPVIVAGTDEGPAGGDIDLTSEPEQDSTNEPDGQPSNKVDPKAKPPEDGKPSESDGKPSESKDAVEEKSIPPPPPKLDSGRQSSRKVKKAPKPNLSMPDENHYITHFPKHPNCETCNRCKVQNEQARRKVDTSDEPEKLKPEKFADSTTADHMILGKEEKNRHGDTVALVCVDRGTHWL